MIDRNFVELNDSLLGINFLEKQDVYGFSYNRAPGREINFKNDVQTSIVYELS